MVAIYIAYVHITELMTMAEHQTFSSQTNHLSGQTKFGCTYYIIIYTLSMKDAAKMDAWTVSVLIISTA